MGVFYIGGLYIYLKRIPEKWYPGKFDILVKLINSLKLDRLLCQINLIYLVNYNIDN